MGRFAWLCEDAPWVVGGFISELGIANMVCVHDVGRELAYGLNHGEHDAKAREKAYR